jgi:hypothetical protein
MLIVSGLSPYTTQDPNRCAFEVVQTNKAHLSRMYMAKSFV